MSINTTLNALTEVYEKMLRVGKYPTSEGHEIKLIDGEWFDAIELLMEYGDSMTSDQKKALSSFIDFWHAVEALENPNSDIFDRTANLMDSTGTR